MANSVYIPTLTALPDVHVVGVCDHNSDKLEQVAAKFPVQSTWLNHQKMLDSIEPDAVFAIGEPHKMFDTWVDCLQRGMNLFIEKPMGLTLHQAQVLANLAERNQCVTQVCFQRRASPLLGELMSRCLTRGAISHASVEFIKNTPGTFVRARDHMYDDGLHAIDTLRHICGGEVTAIHSVVRRVGALDVNLIAALLEFESGVTGQISCNWTSGMRRFRVAIHGPSITAEADLEGQGRVYSDDDLVGVEIDARRAAESDDRNVYCGFQAKITEFLQCLRSRSQPSSCFADALKTHVIAEKILAADLLRRNSSSL